MANEIYCTTWWGDTARTAQMVNGSCDLIQGQLDLIDRITSDGGLVEQTFCVALELHKTSNI
jgi:hypothetical protein